MLETTESGLTVYEEALLAGDYSLGCGIVECSGEHFSLRSSAAQEEERNASADGTSQDIVVTCNSSSGELVEIAAYCYMYNASSQSTGFKEVAVVHILHSNYVPLAIKNNEPYAHLIDMYTSI